MASTRTTDVTDMDARSSESLPTSEYVVIARRYRPKSFGELVGQQQVAQALSNAIATNRVGHAYLFTGARGVGKTSTARILAKCLNCVDGPTATPCGQCDPCQSIATGEDMDVLEIDGASNRGIDEIRQLRANVNVRPSRSRFKIYIIDEVHMLTVQAFNALLKTLEEPPGHVKFIFCTTDAEKIPITVLSRCQRFDFAPVPTDSIVERLRFIVNSEGVEAEDAALQLLARRAGGSMRDSQSLLEQLLSFCGRRIGESDVHAMLGTAQSGRLIAMASHLIDRQAAAALAELDAAVQEGVDVGQLAEQVLGFFRDMLVVTVGGHPDILLHTPTGEYGQLQAAGKKLGAETILAALQILDQAVARMRQSTQVRTLVEIALVRICKLEDLDELPKLIAQLRDGTLPSVPSRPQAAATSASAVAAAAPVTAPVPAVNRRATPVPTTEMSRSAEPPAKKKELDTEPLAVAEAPPISPAPAPARTAAAPLPALTVADFEPAWRQALEEIGGIAVHMAGDYESLQVTGPQQVVVVLRSAYNKEWCERPDARRKLEQTVSRRVGRELRVEFAVTLDPQTPRIDRPPSVQSRLQRMREVEKHPLVREALELFDGEVVRCEEREP